MDNFTESTPNLYRLDLTRPYRGLRLWLPLMLHGVGAFREALAEKLSLARTFHRCLQRLIDEGLGIEIVAEPQLSIVAFRLSRRPGEPLKEWNARNESFHRLINEPQRSFITSTQLTVADGKALTLRVCVLSHRTHIEHVERCIEDIERAARVAH